MESCAAFHTPDSNIFHKSIGFAGHICCLRSVSVQIIQYNLVNVIPDRCSFRFFYRHSALFHFFFRFFLFCGKRCIQHYAGHFFIHSEYLLVFFFLFHNAPVLFSLPAHLPLFLPPLLRPLSPGISFLPCPLVNFLSAVPHPSDKRFLGQNDEADYCQHNQQKHSADHGQGTETEECQRSSQHPASAMVLAASFINFLYLINGILIPGPSRQITYHSDNQEQNHCRRQLPCGDHASPVGNAESHRQEQQDGGNIGGNTQQAEHDIAYDIPCRSYYSKIT